MKFEFTAFPRTQEGRGASRRMRRAGKAPGIVYGGTVAPEPIELDHNALFHALRNEAFHASILTMKLNGGATKVLLRDVQMHPFKNEILHVDFQRVDENRRIHMKVPLHFINGETSPAVKVSGAIVSHVTNELDVSCLPKDLPEFIVVDLATLDVGHSIHVSALTLPPGVTVVLKGKLDPVVAAAVVPKAHIEEEEAAAAKPRLPPKRAPQLSRAPRLPRVRRAPHQPPKARPPRRAARRRKAARTRTTRRSKPSRRFGTKARRGRSRRAFLLQRMRDRYSSPWIPRFALSSDSGTRAASTTPRGTTPGSGSSTRSPRGSAARSSPRAAFTDASRAAVPICGCSSPAPT